MEILALAIICGIAFIPTAISDWIANHNGINEIMKKWIIGPLRIRQPTTWDWIFGWIIIVSWAAFILYMLKGTGGLIRRKPKAKSNFATDLKLLGVGLILASTWLGIKNLLAINSVFIKDNALVPIQILYGKWWKLIPIPFAVFKVGTTLFRIGKTVVKKIIGIPSAIADKAGDLVDTARTLAKED